MMVGMIVGWSGHEPLLIAHGTLCYHVPRMLVDASPLIYLAKLDALDVFRAIGRVAIVTPEVERETSRPALAYDHPDSMLIAEALRTGLIERTTLDEAEVARAATLLEQAGGIGRGEAEVLAAGQARNAPVLLFERRALKLAASLGLEVWSPPRLLIGGTPDPGVARDRLIRFARLVAMPFQDLEQLLARLEEPNR